MVLRSAVRANRYVRFNPVLDGSNLCLFSNELAAVRMERHWRLGNGPAQSSKRFMVVRCQALRQHASKIAAGYLCHSITILSLFLLGRRTKDAVVNVRDCGLQLHLQ